MNHKINMRINFMRELTHCPFCQGDFVVHEVECQGCQTQIKGNFHLNRFHMFNPDDLFFIELFLKNEGNIKLMEKDLGVSYPTIKGRLKNIITTLGYLEGGSPSLDRISILTDLSEGKIDIKGAMKSLKELK